MGTTKDTTKVKIHWSPQEKQELALKSNADEILFGGSRGGGKTDTGMAWLLYDIDKPYYRALVIRRNYTDLSDWIDRAKEMFRPAGGKFTGDTFKFPSGAMIRTGHLADSDAYQKYQGHEYHKMLIEELTHIAKEGDYEKLRMSCRSTTDIKPQVFCTTNPDGAGHEWVKERWNIPDRPTKPVESVSEGLKRVFIPSTVHDNQFLLEKDPSYVQRLESLQDEELKRAWLEGSWEGFGVEGAYYRAQLQRTQEEGRITSVPYDDMLDVYTWCDLGMADSFSIGYFQHSQNQWRVIDYDEFEGESLGYAVESMRGKGYRYAEHYAPHDIEVRELGTGKSRKEVAENLGVRYEVAPKLPVSDGINALRMRFTTLWFDEEKTAPLIKALRNYQKEFDDKRGIYKDKPLHNWASHACFAKGTPILTTDGEKPIESIRAGDTLVTPLGVTEVIDAFSTGIKKTYNFAGMRMTGNHPIATQRGYVSLDMLRYGDIMMVWREKQSFTKELPSTDTQNLSMAVIRSIIAVWWRGVKSRFIGISGNRKLVLSPRDFMFTIKTAIRAIMTLITWKRSTFTTISVVDMEKMQERSDGERSNTHGKALDDGTNHTKVESGTKTWRKRCGRDERKKGGLLRRVKCVGMRIKHTFPNDQSSVEATVRPHIYGEEEVWNVRTKNGTFVANGLVVSNCDMMRYWAVTEIWSQPAQDLYQMHQARAMSRSMK